MHDCIASNVKLRRMIPEDVSALWSIFQEIIREGATYVQDETTTREEFASYWTGRGGEQWIAHEGELLLGGYTLRPNQSGRGSHIATASYVVANQARGRGIGLQMGKHSIDRAEAMGFAALQFNFVVSTNHAAVRLWKGLGFSILGILPQAFRHSDQGLVDAYVMFRKLTPRDDARRKG